MDPVSITMIVLSLANAGYGLIKQNKANQTARIEGQRLTAEQEALNEVERLNNDAAFIQQQADDKQKIADQLKALEEQQQKAKQFATTAILIAVVTMSVLAVYQGLKKVPRTFN